MGSITSKPKLPTDVAENTNLDPRSPTPDVMRTPLNKHATAEAKQKITKNTNLTNTLENGAVEEKLIHNNPILTAVIKNHLQYFDPRSPSQDFERTPIVLDNNDNQNLLQANGYNGSVCFDEGDEYSQDLLSIPETVSKNLIKGFLDVTLDSTFKEPEPLGSSTASQDIIERDTLDPSPEGLLETNFDYMEQSERADNYTFNAPNHNNATSVHGQLIRDAFKNRFNVVEADPRSPSQGIDRTPIVLPEASESLEVEEMSEKRLVAVLQNGIANFRRTPAAEEKNSGLLIYEDDIPKTDELTPKKTKSASTGARTPLSCMKNKEDRSKSAATIVDTKKKPVSRIPKRVSNASRLPILQRMPTMELKKSPDMEFENTPPLSHRDAWDQDSSVVV